jgi:hypothetical protein
MHNKGKFGQPYQAELKRLFKKLSVAKKKAQEIFYVPSNKMKVDAGQSSINMLNDVKEIRKYSVYQGPKLQARYRSNRKAKFLKFVMRLYSVANLIIRKFDQKYHVSVNITRNRLSAMGKKKSVGPNGIPREILTFGGEAMIPYLARLLDIMMNNNAIPGNWKKGMVFPIYKE